MASTSVQPTENVISKNADGVDNGELTITFPDFIADKLRALVKYSNKEQIAFAGVADVNKEINRLSRVYLSEKISSFHKTLSEQLENRADAKARKDFKLYIAKGMDRDDAARLSGFDIGKSIPKSTPEQEKAAAPAIGKQTK